MSNQEVRITQQELKEIFELDRDIAQRQERVDHLKANVKALLVAKMPIEPGRFYARLDYRTVHQPAWKQAVIDNLGADFAEEFRRNSHSSVLCEVRVEEHAILPLWKDRAENSGLQE